MNTEQLIKSIKCQPVKPSTIDFDLHNAVGSILIQERRERLEERIDEAPVKFVLPPSDQIPLLL